MMMMLPVQCKGYCCTMLGWDILILYNTRWVIDITIHHQHNPGNCSAFLVLVNFIQRTFNICCLVVDAIYLMTVVTICGPQCCGHYVRAAGPGRWTMARLPQLLLFHAPTMLIIKRIQPENMSNLIIKIPKNESSNKMTPSGRAFFNVRVNSTSYDSHLSWSLSLYLLFDEVLDPRPRIFRENWLCSEGRVSDKCQRQRLFISKHLQWSVFLAEIWRMGRWLQSFKKFTVKFKGVLKTSTVYV